MVIGTTGHDPKEKAQIEALSNEIPMVWAGNFSTGVNLLFYLTEQAARVLDSDSDFDPEVIEMHHRLKRCSKWNCRPTFRNPEAVEKAL